MRWKIETFNPTATDRGQWLVTDGNRQFICLEYADAVWLRDLLNKLQPE